MIVNQKSLLNAKPIKNMFDKKQHTSTTSFGLSEAGYDIRLKQTITFKKDGAGAVVKISTTVFFTALFF